MTPPAVSPPLTRRRIPAAEILFLFALATLAAGLFAFGVAAALRLLHANLLQQNSWLFGFDARRVLADTLDPASNVRPNIHPLYTTFAKPAARLLQRAGMAPNLSAIVLNAGLVALAAILCGLYGRLRGLPPAEALLLAGLFLASPVTLAIATIVETQAWVVFSLWWVLIVAALTLKLADPSRRRTLALHAAWFISGLFLYGITNLYAVQAALLHAATRRGAIARRAAGSLLFALALLALGLAASCATGAYMDVRHEFWIVTPSARGGSLSWILLRSLANFLLCSVILPIQGRSLDPNPGIPGEWVLSFPRLAYSPLGWVLAGLWTAWLLAAARAALRAGDPPVRRLALGQAACVGFFIVFHCFYYVPWEGLWLYTPAVVPALVAFQVPLLARVAAAPPRRRLALRLALLLCIALLALRHARFLLALPEIFAPVWR